MTKLVVALSLALLSASFAGAADITLKDGRVLRAAVVVRHDAATITFRHSAGFTQIEKSKLPEVVAAEYPLDATEAKLEAERQQQEVLARRAETERLFALRVQLAAAAPKPAEVPASEASEPNATSASATTSWVDTYNYESWRQMRIRARQDERDHDYDRYRAYGRDGDFGRDRHRDRDRDCSPPPRPTSPEIRVTPDVHMTPDVTTVSFTPSPSPEVPPDDDSAQGVKWPRRF